MYKGSKIRKKPFESFHIKRSLGCIDFLSYNISKRSLRKIYLATAPKRFVRVF